MNFRIGECHDGLNGGSLTMGVIVEMQTNVGGNLDELDFGFGAVVGYEMEFDLSSRMVCYGSYNLESVCVSVVIENECDVDGVVVFRHFFFLFERGWWR